MPVKHTTSSVLLFHRFGDEWKTCLIYHPRLHRWMAPGGHVESNEHQAEAALREVEEETGLAGVRLLGNVGQPPLPLGFPETHIQMPLPWWIIEQQVPADSHCSEPHVHIDHQYIATIDNPTPVGEQEHAFAWLGRTELDAAEMFEDTRLMAKMILSYLSSEVPDSARLIAKWRKTSTLASQYGFEGDAQEWNEAANALEKILSERDEWKFAAEGWERAANDLELDQPLVKLQDLQERLRELNG